MKRKYLLLIVFIYYNHFMSSKVSTEVTKLTLDSHGMSVETKEQASIVRSIPGNG